MPYMKDTSTGERVYASTVECSVIAKENAAEKAAEARRPEAWINAIKESNHRAAQEAEIRKKGEEIRAAESPQQRFARNVTALCKIKNKFIGDVEKACGFSKGNISRIRSGNLQITLNNAINIAGILETPLQDMITKDFYIQARLAELNAFISQLVSQRDALINAN